MSNLILETTEMRKAYSETLKELIKEDKNVYVLEADLSEAITTTSIGVDYPNNFVNCGIMEANMVGVASGLSLLGKIPFIHTFSPFATRRCYDQIFLSGAYAKTNIKILGSDTGITSQHNGGTHTSFEDIALMREIPGATVITATDSTMLKYLIREIKDIYGIHYITTIRKNAYKIYDENEKFEIGKGKVLKDGKDFTIISNGIMVAEALKAAEELEKQGISAAVIDMFTVKPIDKDLIIEYAKKTGKIITAENHNVTGGLGSAVADVLVENYPVPMRKVGVEDRFGQVGTQDFLQKEYGLTAEKIIEKASELALGGKAMKIFIDTANVNEIREAAKMGCISGVTTNPSLIAKEGRDFKEVVTEICEIVDGPISAEVISLKADEMIAEALELAKIHSNIVIKLPITKDGLEACRHLVNRGIKTNVTLIFTANQALLAARAGATYVSPFLGRLDDTGVNGIELIKEIAEIFKIHNISSEIIAASIRNTYHSKEAAKAGAHIGTIPYPVLCKMLEHPLTDAGIAKFLADWNR